MAKRSDETEVEFEYKARFDENYKSPLPRKITVQFYGGTAEECIQKARESHKLDPEFWLLVGVKGPDSV